MSKAVDAIDIVSGFAVGDGANTGASSPLPGSGRLRVGADLFAVLLLGAVQTQFGVTIVQSCHRSRRPLKANRIDAAPATAGVPELKEWMSLLFYLDGGLGGSITSEYASTADFTQFGSYGIAVTNRNASYPIASIGQFVGTVASLQSAP